MEQTFMISASHAKSSWELPRVPPITGQTIGFPPTEPKVVKEGWLFIRGELSKSWRKRYFVLLDDGSFLGYKARCVSNALHRFTVRGCEVTTQDKPRRSSFIIRGLRSGVIERTFSVSSDLHRAIWIKAIQLVDRGLLEASENTNGAQTSEHEGSLDSSPVRSSEITLERFELIRMLGSGHCGKVVLGKDKSSDRVVAIKIPRKKIMALEEGAAEKVSTECRVLQSTRHPFLTSLCGSFQARERECLAMEFVSGGELSTHLAREKVFGERKSRFYGAEILLAIEYLHSKGIIHRDIKLSNILVAGDGHIKLADFGLCKEDMFHGKRTRTLCGTPQYMAPEILGYFPYDRAVDFWALGVVMYRMMCGRFPFNSPARHILYDEIIYDEVAIPSSLSLNARSLLQGLLTKDPGTRLGGGERGAEDVREHGFFRKIQWKKLLAKNIRPPFAPQTSPEDDTRNFDPRLTEEDLLMTTQSRRQSSPDDEWSKVEITGWSAS